MKRPTNRKPQNKTRRLLRRRETWPEKVFWKAIRRRQVLGVKFRRQVSIGRYIADFYSFEKTIVIEIDGESHFESIMAIKYDERRTRYIESKGIKVIRFRNEEVLENLSECIAVLEKELVNQRG